MNYPVVEPRLERDSSKWSTQGQEFDKGKLAKCWGVWYQQIEEVSLGTEKYHPALG